jgi:hypothetical protein
MGAFYNVLLALFAATGSFLFGYDSGVMTDGEWLPIGDAT